MQVENHSRLRSLDAFRGFVMMVLVAGPLLAGLSSRFEAQAFFAFVAAQLEHADWEGFRFWDLVMPSFMVMVGVSIPFSVASRRARGASTAQLWAHVLKRSAIFIALGLLLTSRGEPQTRFNFTGLLTQFGLAYPFAFLLVGRGRWTQAAVGATILMGVWLAFVLHPAPPPGFDYSSVGLPEHVEPFTGLFAHWNRGTNLAARFDLFFLNLFPRVTEFRFDPLGNQTLNFIPSIVTMAIGIRVGEMLRESPVPADALRRLVGLGGVLLGLGWIAGSTLSPLVKSLWTPSWVLFSGGAALLMLAVFYWAVEVKGWARVAFPFSIVGMNAMTIYLLNSISRPWIEETLQVHLTSSWALRNVLAVALLWAISLWMYRRRIFVRV